MTDKKMGKTLSTMIKKAISDCELTNSEHEAILEHAHEDGIIDSQERSLLNQLQALIANGTVKRVPG